MIVAIYLTLVLSFATFATAHLALVFGLAVRRPHWRGAVGLVILPLAPYWGLREGLRTRSVIWLVGLGTYTVALIAAYLMVP